MYPHDRYWQAKKVTLIGAFINALLGIVKMIGGFLYHSHALIADGVHSISDLITDVMVVFASKYGSVSADDSHPYGHQRIETAATLLLSLLLILAGCGIAWDALDELLKSDHTMPNWLSIPIVGFSIIANEALFHYTRHVGKQISSQLIIANAWHHRSDAASSIVVLIGLIGSLAGLVYLDAIAAVIVSLMIIKMGWSYGWNSVKELVDTAVDAELFSQIERVIQSIDGVKRIHQLRSRFMGSDVLIDVHILVSPKISVSEGHYIAQHVHHTLVKKIDCVRDVIVHVDPEDDEISCPSLHLPSRAMLQEKFFHDICYDFPQILFWNIHYLNGKMSLDIFCSYGFNQWKKLHNRVISTLKSQTDIEEVRLFGLYEVTHHPSD
ncbi:TPA: cation transporter [Legionella pneumophila]|nr:cation diffusion facilitator family transporter [Legionella pneumophila]HAU1320534.1 cation transporter [Legionella pneumophila]HBC0467835.1 cation transporter [Legionella pneumophila]HBD9375367.1 cation transporter [Legionella pneumophila]HBI2946164.1 cation transporter [Legionella pneumophila]